MSLLLIPPPFHAVKRLDKFIISTRAINIKGLATENVDMRNIALIWFITTFDVGGCVFIHPSSHYTHKPPTSTQLTAKVI